MNMTCLNIASTSNDSDYLAGAKKLRACHKNL